MKALRLGRFDGVRDMNRATEAEHLLADAGMNASVESAGLEGEVAVIRYRHPKGQGEALGVERRCLAVDCCTAVGFRYVTLELY